MLNKLFKASRPATLGVSILSTFLGIIISYRQGYIFQSPLWDVWRIFLVITAAVLLQSGMNMMNNYFEQGACKSSLEKLTIKAGIFAAYAYAGEPFNYKRFGLGAIILLL